MKVHIDRLIKHLNAQIDAATAIGSDWVYITKDQANKCLELAEAEDTILEMAEAIPPDIAEHEFGNEYRCGNCSFMLAFGAPHEILTAGTKRARAFCPACGKAVKWE